MSATGLEPSIVEILTEANEEGGFPLSLVSTDQGLLVACAGDEPLLDENIAALTALFDDVVRRSRRDLTLTAIDELTIRDSEVGRLVVRPLKTTTPRMFLVVRVPRSRPWRRVSNQLVRDLEARLASYGDLAVTP
ncbi:MAG: hypothetical protein KTR31_40695 [Myxococcales bacterium]|nr:hypothetical protein [Myxococcales bacterium]